jgi:uncharacterized protein (DUF342 family)
MSNESETARKLLLVTVSKDGMVAAVQLRGAVRDVPLTAELVAEELAAQEIRVTDEVRERVAAFVASIEAGEASKEPFVVAQGVPAQDGVHESFSYSEAFHKEAAAWKGDAPVNYYNFNSIMTVESGMPLGTIEPAHPAKSGHNVRGAVIEASVQPETITVDENSVERTGKSGMDLVAKTPGRLMIQDRRIWIDEVYKVDGDVDFSTGNVDAKIDVVVRGNILDRFEVRTTNSLTVGGTIEAALVEVGKDLSIRGGIVGRGAGSVQVGGDMVVRFGNEAKLRAEGDIKFMRELLNCSAHAEQRIDAEHGAIIGGYLYAAREIVVGTLGSDGNIPTRIAVGPHPTVLIEAEEIEDEIAKKRQAIEKIRQMVSPLVANMRRLSAAQREQATELLFKADEAEVQVAEAEQRRRTLLRGSADEHPPRVKVEKLAYPGVQISIGDRLTVIEREMKGPFVIERRRVKNVTEFVSVNQLTGSIQVLPCTKPPTEMLVEGYALPAEKEADSDADGAQDAGAEEMV